MCFEMTIIYCSSGAGGDISINGAVAGEASTRSGWITDCYGDDAWHASGEQERRRRVLAQQHATAHSKNKVSTRSGQRAPKSQVGFSGQLAAGRTPPHVGTTSVSLSQFAGTNPYQHYVHGAVEVHHSVESVSQNQSRSRSVSPFKKENKYHAMMLDNINRNNAARQQQAQVPDGTGANQQQQIQNKNNKNAKEQHDKLLKQNSFENKFNDDGTRRMTEGLPPSYWWATEHMNKEEEAMKWNPQGDAEKRLLYQMSGLQVRQEVVIAPQSK